MPFCAKAFTSQACTNASFADVVMEEEEEELAEQAAEEDDEAAT